MKIRVLNERLAAILATARHGEMIFVADAGSGSASNALIPLDPGVEYLDLGVVTGVPSFLDVVSGLIAAGDIESIIVADEMPMVNPAYYKALCSLIGKDNVWFVKYIPELYDLRNKCKAMVQTGDYGLQGNAVLVAGYPSTKIPLNWLKERDPSAYADPASKKMEDG